MFKSAVSAAARSATAASKTSTFARHFSAARKAAEAPTAAAAPASGVRRVTLFAGDGIGPEIATAVQEIFAVSAVCRMFSLLCLQCA